MGLDWWLLNLILLVGKLDTRYSPSHQIHGMWFLLIRKQIESGTIFSSSRDPRHFWLGPPWIFFLVSPVFDSGSSGSESGNPKKDCWVALGLSDLPEKGTLEKGMQYSSGPLQKLLGRDPQSFQPGSKKEATRHTWEGCALCFFF